MSQYYRDYEFEAQEYRLHFGDNYINEDMIFRGPVLENNFHHFFKNTHYYKNNRYEIVTESQLKGEYYDNNGNLCYVERHPLYWKLYDFSRDFYGKLRHAGVYTPDYVIFDHLLRRVLVIDVTLNIPKLGIKEKKYLDYASLLHNLYGYESDYVDACYLSEFVSFNDVDTLTNDANNFLEFGLYIH